jgi:hypothetical protein
MKKLFVILSILSSCSPESPIYLCSNGKMNGKAVITDLPKVTNSADTNQQITFQMYSHDCGCKCMGFNFVKKTSPYSLGDSVIVRNGQILSLK